MPHADPIARRAYHRNYRRANRWRYRARAKVWGAARNANGRAELAGAPGRLTADEVAVIFAAGACFYCGSTERLGLDHVVPLAHGGVNRPENIVCACDGCNKSKWTIDRPWRWSRRRDECRRCGSSARPHLARDMCGRCYRQTFGSRAARAARRLEMSEAAKEASLMGATSEQIDAIERISDSATSRPAPPTTLRPGYPGPSDAQGVDESPEVHEDTSAAPTMTPHERTSR